MTTSVGSYYKNIRRFFEQTAHAEARRTKFVQRHSKINGSIFLQGLVWTVYRFGTLTLSGLRGTIEKLQPEAEASEQALDQRFNEPAVAFVQGMFSLAMQQSFAFPCSYLPLLSFFTSVFLLDSSAVSLPDCLKMVFPGSGGSASKAALKVFMLLDWTKGKYETIEITEGKRADQGMGKTFLEDKPKGSLWLFDLGFWSLEFLRGIAAQESFFLSRLQSQVAISLRAGVEIIRFDLDLFLGKAPKDRVFEMDVLVGAANQLAGRLVCIPLPEEVASQRRRRARADAKRKGRTAGEKTLKRLDWGLFVTNAPKEALPTEAIDVIYRVRWQIELIFKLAKTDAALDKTNSQKEHRVLCEFYAKLISLIFFEGLMALLNGQATLSRPKTWRRFKDEAMNWGAKLRSGSGLAQLRSIIAYLQRHARRSKKVKNPSTLQRIENAAMNHTITQLLDPIGFLQSRQIHGPSRDHNFFSCQIPPAKPEACKTMDRSKRL